MIRKTRRWFHTLGKKPRCYRVNDVTYIVTSKFERNGTEHTMQTRVAEAIKNDMVEFPQLQPEEKTCILNEEYVCSAAGKED